MKSGLKWIEKAPTVVVPGQPPCRVFQAKAEDGHFTAIVAHEPLGKDGALRWHLSLSHRSNVLRSPEGRPLPGRLPEWDEIKDARYALLPDETYMAMILPPMAEYVNFHPTTMHLHEMEPEDVRP